MTVWQKLENENCYAVAIYNFAAPSSRQIQLDVGELVHLERETDSWYWGRSLRRNNCGAFPKTYVVIRDCIVDRCGDAVVASAGGGGVVHDIAVTLREWLKHWKKLYTNNDERFKFMEVSMRALFELRAQAASGALPQDQLRRVARTAVFTIDKGNRTLDMELAVRNPSGQLVNPLQMSTYKLNALHDETNMRIDKNKESTPVSPPSTTSAGSARCYAVCVRVHNFVCRVNDPAELLVALYDPHGNKLTDHLLLRWPLNLNTTQVVFTDLGSDIKREKVFLVCQVVRLGSLDPQPVDIRRSSVAQNFAVHSGTVGIRRPFGVACLDVTRLLAANDPEKHIQLPFFPCEKETMDTLLKKVLANRDLKDTKHSQGLWVTLQMVEGDIRQIREKNPHVVVGNTAVARKIGFPEVILPGDARNDLYVTVCSGSFSKGGKSSERNIEVTARVVDRYGSTLRGVISIGAGMPLVDEYTSLVYYHDDRPRWQEVFKICLSIEQFKEAHLVFLCRHRSSNEAKDKAQGHFALSYLRLMQRDGTTTPDRLHNLCVYKIHVYDNKRFNPAEIEMRAAANSLCLPSRKDELPAGAEKGLKEGVLSLVYRDSLTVNTKLCSTKLTQREEILGVLKWSAHVAAGTLRAALTKLLQVPSEELVKFLQDILDALFNILTQVEEDQEEYNDESYGVLVLDGLLRIISLVADHKYQHFQPVLHEYIDTSFCDALAYEKLILVMVWVINSAERGEMALKRLLQCMKCLECLVRIIVRSRELRSALGDTKAQFKYQFEKVLEALVGLMRCGDPLLTCQGSALKYLPHAVPHALNVYPDTDLSAYIVRALAALALPRLSKQRMLALLELVRGPLCRAANARALLLPHLADTVCTLLRDKAELDRDAAHKWRSVDKAARLLGADTARLQDHTHHQQIVELCVETLGEVVTLLSRDDVGPIEADKEELARRLLPTVLHTATAMLKDRDEGGNDDGLLRRIICVLLDMVRQMSDEQYTVVVRALEAESRGGSASLIEDALQLLLALLRKPVFKTHWADMLHLQHYIMLHALKLISTTLLERLKIAEDAGEVKVYAMLRKWFDSISALATSETLQLERFSAAKLQRTRSLYGDIRRSAAEVLANMWFSLGDHKRAFIPYLVGPFLEVSFLEDDEVRNTTIPLFFDMMQTEYTHSVESGETEGYLKEMESEVTDKLDVIAADGRGDSQWRARFVSLCGALCARSPPGLRSAGAAVVAAAARQLDTLLQYRAAQTRTAAAHRMHLITTVLDFYEQIKRPHMYIRYVHRLVEMHRAASQWAEAGLSLRLHATLLRWTHEALPPRLRHPDRPADTYTTHRELKENLYLEVSNLLNQGRQWELAIEIIKELVTVYEDEALGYGPLAELHTQLATLYTAILRNPRSHPEYFRVIYHGKGFPEHLRVAKGFVYRGNEYEQLADFNERLLDEWPEAEILLKLDPPGEEITESDGQYLQVNAIKPVMGDKLKRWSGKPIAEQIRKYYQHNNVAKFVFNRPYHRPEESIDGSNDDLASQNEFATRWLERTEIEISDTLPGILRWSPIVRQHTYWVSPVEAAVETLRESNRTLKALAMEAQAPDAALHPLTLRLNGILDPAVQGGIVNYERAFLTAVYETRHPEHMEFLQQLKDLIAEQIPILNFGLEVHEARMPLEMEGLHQHMVTCFHRMKLHVHQRYGRKMCDFDPEIQEVQLRMQLNRDSLEADPSNIANNRMSDISTGNDSATKSRFFSFSLQSNLPLTRNSGASYFGTLQTPQKRRAKRRQGKSDLGSQTSASQWYTTPNGSVTNISNNFVNSSAINTPTSNGTSQPETPSPSPLRELRQELVTERPLRAEVERERRLSQRASLLTSSAPHSNRNSIGTTDSNQDEEEPPPLPQKSSQRSLDVDAENNNQESTPLQPRHSYDTVLSPRGSFLYTSMAYRRNANRDKNDKTDKAPTPPPKKKNLHNNNCSP